jgi:hexosaminidase
MWDLVTAGTKSQIILSPSDLLYLSKGQGNLWLNGTQGAYSVWRQIYEKLVVFPAGVDATRILGAEVCLWGEVSNEDTLENNLWMRASAFAGRVWSATTLQTHELVGKLVEIQRALEKMNVSPSPITSEFCEYKPLVCFPPAAVVEAEM